MIRAIAVCAALFLITDSIVSLGLIGALELFAVGASLGVLITYATWKD